MAKTREETTKERRGDYKTVKKEERGRNERRQT